MKKRLNLELLKDSEDLTGNYILEVESITYE